MPTELANLSALAPQTPASTGAFSQLTENFDTFLTLLTTQLRNQDPLEPLDTEQFTQQLVQFAGVEQSIQTNANLETLIALQSATDRQASLNLVGRAVSVSSDEATLSADTNSAARWRYNLPGNVTSLNLNVVDESGRVITTLNGPRTGGSHDLIWDGRLSNGTRAPAGTYRLEATASLSNGTALTPTVEVRGVVESVVLNNGNPQLSLNGQLLPLDAVTRVDAAL